MEAEGEKNLWGEIYEFTVIKGRHFRCAYIERNIEACI